MGPRELPADGLAPDLEHDRDRADARRPRRGRLPGARPEERGRAFPISGRSRKVPAIWNLASAKGLKVGVVGWWATWPAEKVNGFLVSDRAAPVLFDPEVLVKSQAITWPEGLADGVRIVLKREWNPPYEEVGEGAPRLPRRVRRRPWRPAATSQDPITGYRKILAGTSGSTRRSPSTSTSASGPSC